MLDAGTNSGKTYFILKTLLPWAYEHRKRILILCNREALRNQIERDVNRLGSICWIFSCPAAWKNGHPLSSSMEKR